MKQSSATGIIAGFFALGFCLVLGYAFHYPAIGHLVGWPALIYLASQGTD